MMRLKFALATLALSLTAPALAQDKPEPARVYKDWVVGCDRFSNCEAVALLPPDFDWSNGAAALIFEVRSNGQVRLALTSSHGEEITAQTVYLQVDGQPLTSLRYSDEADLSYTDISRDQARVLANGRVAKLVDGKGTLVALVSLSGSSAAMRDMDARQGNVGFGHALVARGSKKLPEPTALNRMAVTRLIPSNDGPPETIFVEAAAFAECLEDRMEGPDHADVMMPLPTQVGHPKKVLILVGCGHGAYNIITRPVIATRHNDGWTLSKANWRHSYETRETQDFDYLVNAYWDDAHELRHYSKGRGLGDCGDSAVYTWTGDPEIGPGFVLTERREMPVCRGVAYWPRIW